MPRTWNSVIGLPPSMGSMVSGRQREAPGGPLSGRFAGVPARGPPGASGVRSAIPAMPNATLREAPGKLLSRTPRDASLVPKLGGASEVHPSGTPAKRPEGWTSDASSGLWRVPLNYALEVRPRRQRSEGVAPIAGEAGGAEGVGDGGVDVAD